MVKTLPEHDEKYERNHLLSTILSMELSVSEKLGIMENEYQNSVDDEFRKDVSVMSNLGQGMKEVATDEANAKFILSMYRKGYSLRSWICM